MPGAGDGAFADQHGDGRNWKVARVKQHAVADVITHSETLAVQIDEHEMVIGEDGVVLEDELVNRRACRADGLHGGEKRERARILFDATAGKVVKYLPLIEENGVIAAGMTKLFVLLPGANVFQRWNLLTFEKEKKLA